MYPAERQSEILRIAHDNGGAVSVTALAERLDVASETVRRDLDVLERQGRVSRHRGGAALVGRAPFEAALARRLDEGPDAEASIAAASLAEAAARPRTARAPEEADELVTACTRLLAIARDGKRPRARRVAAVRALRMLAERGCVRREDVPSDVDAP